jgi:hypothetical protein
MGFLLNNWVLLSVLLSIFVYGWITNIIKLRRKQEDIKFIESFKNDFVKLINAFSKKKKINDVLYNDLIDKTIKLDNIAGDYTVIDLISKIDNLKYNNFRVSLQILPRIKTFDLTNPYHLAELEKLSNFFYDGLGLCVGSIKEDIVNLRKDRFNLIKIFSKPITFLVSTLNSLLGFSFIEKKLHPISTILSIIAYSMVIYFYSTH